MKTKDETDLGSEWETAIPSLSMTISGSSLAIFAGTVLCIGFVAFAVFYIVMSRHLLLMLALAAFSLAASARIIRTAIRRARNGTVFRWNKERLEWGSRGAQNASVRWSDVRKVDFPTQRLNLNSGQEVDLRFFPSDLPDSPGIAKRLVKSSMVPVNIKTAFPLSKKSSRLTLRERILLGIILAVATLIYTLYLIQALPTYIMVILFILECIVVLAGFFYTQHSGASPSPSMVAIENESPPNA